MQLLTRLDESVMVGRILLPFCLIMLWVCSTILQPSFPNIALQDRTNQNLSVILHYMMLKKAIHNDVELASADPRIELVFT